MKCILFSSVTIYTTVYVVGVLTWIDGREFKNCKQGRTVTFLNLPRGITWGRINYSKLEKKGKFLCLGCVQVHRFVCMCVCVYFVYVYSVYCVYSIHTHTHTRVYAVLYLVTQSCPTLCDPMDYSPLGSSVHQDSSGKNQEYWSGFPCPPPEYVFIYIYKHIYIYGVRERVLIWTYANDWLP